MHANPVHKPVLHLMCGKIAAGKSTLSQRLAAQPHTLLISEDHWLSRLYGNEIHSLEHYVHRAGQLREALGPHVEAILRGGLSVVLDFPANTPNQRGWMKAIIDHSGADHALHYLDVPDAVCKQRLHARNASGEHPFAPTDEEFEAIHRHFVPPADHEGFTVIRHPA